MELLKHMIIHTYPDAVIKDITDVAHRVSDWGRIHKLMLTLTLRDNAFVVFEIPKKKTSQGLLKNLINMMRSHATSLKT